MRILKDKNKFCDCYFMAILIEKRWYKHNWEEKHKKEREREWKEEHREREMTDRKRKEGYSDKDKHR